MTLTPSRTDLGARARIETLFRENSDFVFRCIRRMGVTAAEAEELSQEVFLVAHEKIASYRDEGTPRAWLFQIARNLTMRHRRGHAREQQRLERVAGEEADVEPPPLPDEKLARLEGAQVIEAFLQQLPESQREIFVLSDVEGLTAPEVAEITGVNVNTIYSRLRLARDKLGGLLSRRQAIREREERSHVS